MAIDIYDLRQVLSGGASNVTPASALGGAISTQAGGVVKSQTATAPVNITGVTIVDAYGNAAGVGSFQYINSPKSLNWKPFGSPSYVSKSIATDGTYSIGDALGYLVVTVTFASLPTSNKTDTITIGYNQNNVFDAVTAAQSLAGKVSYRCIYIKNNHSTDTAFGVTVWIKQQTPAGDDFAIGLDPAGVGDGSSTGVATTIANELTAPAGVTFSSPLTQGTGLSIGDLDAGEVQAVWYRRTVPAETRGTVIGNTAIIAFSADL